MKLDSNWIDDTVYRFDRGECRICKHFEGREKGTCPAYPKEIPDKFALHGKRHDAIETDQTGETIFAYKSAD
jgi:hypothetical protein